jgi:hypothetical protein
LILNKLPVKNLFYTNNKPGLLWSKPDQDLGMARIGLYFKGDWIAWAGLNKADKYRSPPNAGGFIACRRCLSVLA